MAIRNRQIGWSNKSNLLYDILGELNSIKGQFYNPTPPGPIDTLVSVSVSGVQSDFDIPYNKCSFGCWINMANDAGFPRLFSFGQYPSATQAISIEGGTLYFWYGGGVVLTYSLTDYIGNWMWVSILGDTGGSVQLWIDGVQVATGTAGGSVTLSETIYVGSENAPDTYYNGLMAGIIFDGGDIDLTIPPTTPFTPAPSTFLLFGQGGNLAEQTTDNGIYSRPITYNNLSYSASSPYSPANGGSLKFGA